VALLTQIVANYLRTLHLLQSADYVMFAIDVLKNRKANKLFLAGHTDFIPPLAHLAYDAYNHTNWQLYYDMGLSHARLISDLTREHVSGDGIRICEWGCGPARIIRHLGEIPGFTRVELSGTDYNEETIAWCKKNIADVHFAKTGLEPPLPFETGALDCVYAISVFTHLSERMHYAWIEELFRIIRQDGILIFTTHGDTCARRLLPADRKKYDSGSLVIKSQVEEGKKHYVAYHPPQFIKNKLLQNHVVIRHISVPSEYDMEQEVWVVRKGEM
jgi:SAM-dependent methyltransferase